MLKMTQTRMGLAKQMWSWFGDTQ